MSLQYRENVHPKIFWFENKFVVLCFSSRGSHYPSMNRVTFVKTFVRSFVKNWGEKKITRDAKLFRILTFRFFDITHFLSGVSYARTHKLNAWVDKKFAIVETRLWKERVVNNGYTSMSRQRSSVIARLVHLDHGSDPALNRLFLQPIFSSCNF